jgi:DME family drug/metabolite transporter
VSLPPQALALGSAACSATAAVLIQRGLRTSNFYAGSWINVATGAVALWAAVLLLVPRSEWSWQAVPYFVASGFIGTGLGRMFRVAAIERVGAPVAQAINNLSPLVATGLAVALLGEHVTPAVLLGTLVIVLGTVLLSLSGRTVGFRPRDLVLPFVGAACFGLVAVIRKLGVTEAGPLFDAAVNTTTALAASSAFVLAAGKRTALACDRPSLLWFIGGGIAENAGVFLVLVALGFGTVSVVVPLSGTSPLFVLLLTLLFPARDRRLSGRVVAGAVLIVLGVFVLTGGTRLLW